MDVVDSDDEMQGVETKVDATNLLNEYPTQPSTLPKRVSWTQIRPVSAYVS